MPGRKAFEAKGSWYKGNLHTHTTLSDGALSPKEMAARYKRAGYDFLAITDHGKVTSVRGLSRNNFLVISGEEVSVGRTFLGHSFHLVAINLKEAIEGGEEKDPKEVARLIRSSGGLVLLGHPYWSALSASDIIGLGDEIVGVEIFNASCFYSIGKGYSLVHWDDLLIRGKRLWGFAVDDAHYHFNDHRPHDTARAWIAVKAPALTPKDILKAIETGRFYASFGPEISDLKVGKEAITVRTSGARVINFIADASHGESFTALSEAPLMEATYKLRGKEKYIRIECIDERGRAAWTNPIFISAGR